MLQHRVNAADPAHPRMKDLAALLTSVAKALLHGRTVPVLLERVINSLSGRSGENDAEVAAPADLANAAEVAPERKQPQDADGAEVTAVLADFLPGGVERRAELPARRGWWQQEGHVMHESRLLQLIQSTLTDDKAAEKAVTVVRLLRDMGVLMDLWRSGKRGRRPHSQRGDGSDRLPAKSMNLVVNPEWLAKLIGWVVDRGTVSSAEPAAKIVLADIAKRPPLKVAFTDSSVSFVAVRELLQRPSVRKSLDLPDAASTMATTFEDRFGCKEHELIIYILLHKGIAVVDKARTPHDHLIIPCRAPHFRLDLKQRRVWEATDGELERVLFGRRVVIGSLAAVLTPSILTRIMQREQSGNHSSVSQLWTAVHEILFYDAMRMHRVLLSVLEDGTGIDIVVDGPRGLGVGARLRQLVQYVRDEVAFLLQETRPHNDAEGIPTVAPTGVDDTCEEFAL
jgi:hypothetical protein